MVTNAQWRSDFASRLGGLLSSHAIDIIPNVEAGVLRYLPADGEQSTLEPLVQFPFADTLFMAAPQEPAGSMTGRLAGLPPALQRERYALQALIDGAAVARDSAARSRRRPSPPADWHQAIERDAGDVIGYSRKLNEGMNTTLRRWQATRSFFRSMGVLVERLGEKERPCHVAMIAEVGLAASRRAYLHARRTEEGVKALAGRDRPDAQARIWRYADESAMPDFFADVAAKAWARSVALFEDEASERYRIDRALHSSWDASSDTYISTLRLSASWSFQHEAEEKGIADSLRAALALAGQKMFGEEDREELCCEIAFAAGRLQRNGDRRFSLKLQELAAGAEKLPLNPAN